MGCIYQPNCGGCCYRELSIEQYRLEKERKVKNILDKGLCSSHYQWESPVFLDDGTRRRATFAFKYTKKKLVFGFNAENSSEILNCSKCLMLTSKINALLPQMYELLQKLCEIKVVERQKAKKVIEKNISSGDVLVLEADNGIDLVLETDFELSLDHRMDIFDFMNSNDEVIRFSHRHKSMEEAEPIVEKVKPVVKIGGYDVFVAQGMFLQASKAGQEALVSLVMKYLGETKGMIADLFCGIGTFTYSLAAVGNKVMAYDLSEGLLNGFRASVHRQMLHNVEIIKQNLFKYPLDHKQLSQFDAVIFDPPRAGASAQVKELATLDYEQKPSKVIAVSCNPHSFVNDANALVEGGYKLEKVTLVDQFVYSNHSELVALFTK